MKQALVITFPNFSAHSISQNQILFILQWESFNEEKDWKARCFCKFGTLKLHGSMVHSPLTQCDRPISTFISTLQSSRLLIFASSNLQQSYQGSPHTYLSLKLQFCIHNSSKCMCTSHLTFIRSKIKLLTSPKTCSSHSLPHLS